MQQPPALTPQQAAIQMVRSRYEQGELSFERFKYALNALLQAQTPEQCQAILDELPVAPPDPFPAQAPQPWQQGQSKPKRRWLVALIGGIERTSRPWRLHEHTVGVIGIGGMELDLSLAALPQYAVLKLFMLIGGIELAVPREVSVTVKAFTLLGGVEMPGEERGGIFSFCHEEIPAEETALAPAGAAPHVELQVFTLIGGVEIKRVQGPHVSVIAKAANERKMLTQPE